MPPESKIEDLLKATAAARRAEFGDDQKMPNPMRARLQDEIARLNRSDETSARPSWLAKFWPQFSLVGAIAALLVTSAVWWGEREKSSSGGSVQLAMRESAPGQNAAEPADALRSLETSPPTESKSNSITGMVAQNGPRAEPEPQSAAAAAPAPATEHFAATEGALNLQRQYSRPERGQAMQNNSQQQQSSKILNNFQVEQEGNTIRLVDADGSTYAGNFETRAATETHRRSALKTKTVASSAASSSGNSNTSSNERFFRASGFNTSLQKRVVFEGNYIAGAGEERKRARDQKENATQSSVRIVGTAQVPGEAPVEVDAAAVSP